MEELKEKLERIKDYVSEILNDYGFQHMYCARDIEEHVLHPHTSTYNPYQTALDYIDRLINK